MFLPLAALSKDKSTLVPFKLNDGPCALNDKFFILMVRPGTPILRYDSIFRRIPNTHICEGSILDVDGEQYIVKYHRGFNAVSQSKKVIETLTPDMKILGHVNSIQSEFTPMKGVTPKYEIRGEYVTFRKFHGILKKKLLVRNKRINTAMFCEIMEYAGISYNGKKAYFGNKNENDEYLRLVDGKPKFI